MRSLLRNEDERCADIISKALDNLFYKNVSNFERVFDKERQVKGIDTLFTFNNKVYTCDEKAAIRYVNKGLNTFSLELFFVNRNNNLNKGWLIDDKKENNSFLFIWIDKADNDILQSEKDISEMEIALVCRNKIISFLETLGWNKESLIKKSEKIITNEYEYLGNVKKDGCKFSYSRGLIEKPINVLLSRDTLKNISDFTLKYVIKK